MKKWYLIVGVLTIMLLALSCAAPPVEVAPPEEVAPEEVLESASFSTETSLEIPDPWCATATVKVTNISDAPAELLKVRVEFLDATGDVIGVREALPVVGGLGVTGLGATLAPSESIMVDVTIWHAGVSRNGADARAEAEGIIVE